VLAAIIAFARQFDQLHACFDQFDCRKELRPLQAVLVQLIGMLVGGRDERHARLEQSLQQPAHQHRVADIGDVKLVEAQKPALPSHPRSNQTQRVCLALQVAQMMVHLLHEAVKMNAALAMHRRQPSEFVHQKTLAAANRPPQVNSAHRPGTSEKPQPAGQTRPAVLKIAIHPLKGVQRVDLSGVEGEAVLPRARLERAKNARRTALRRSMRGRGTQ
jgi:hypothetical protein